MRALIVGMWLAASPATGQMRGAVPALRLQVRGTLDEAATAPLTPVLPVVAAAVAPAAESLSSPEAEPALAFPVRPEGRPIVLRSLRSLSMLLKGGERSFDAPIPEAPAVLPGMNAAEVYSSRSEIFWALPRDLRHALAAHPPLDVYAYRDGKGGALFTLRVTHANINSDSFPGLKPHEIPTVRKILTVAKDVQVIVLEEPLTPDLVVDGTITEMKSVRGEGVSREIVRANSQLLEHMRRHGRAPGAIVLDVQGPERPAESIELGIKEALLGRERRGFEKIYAFNGGRWQTYAAGVDGGFILLPDARPFSANEVAPSPL